MNQKNINIHIRTLIMLVAATKVPSAGLTFVVSLMLGEDEVSETAKDATDPQRSDTSCATASLGKYSLLDLNRLQSDSSISLVRMKSYRCTVDLVRYGDR